MGKKLLVSASTLPPDETKLADYIKELRGAGVDMLHCDIMDGKFVQGKTYDFKLLGKLRKISSLPFDVHLMVENPASLIGLYIKNGADFLTVHLEAFTDAAMLRTALESLKASGMRVGLSIKPKTPLEEIFPYMNLLDLVLLMSVEPGAGGQSFLEGSLRRIAALKSKREKEGLSFLIEVDGGINLTNVSAIRRAGADIVVVGSALFNAEDKGAFISAVHDI